MATQLLQPRQIRPRDPLFNQLLSWPFHEPYVGRLLRNDIPQRARNGNGRIWVYEDDLSKTIVGFGTIDVCPEYSKLTGGQFHPLIPLLAVHPLHEGRGYGGFIVDHLIGEAVLLARQPHAGCCDLLFLDVYESNIRAVYLYEKRGFVREGLRRMQYRSGDRFRDEVLMAWFPGAEAAS